MEEALLRRPQDPHCHGDQRLAWRGDGWDATLGGEHPGPRRGEPRQPGRPQAVSLRTRVSEGTHAGRNPE